VRFINKLMKQFPQRLIYEANFYLSFCALSINFLDFRSEKSTSENVWVGKKSSQFYCETDGL